MANNRFDTSPEIDTPAEVGRNGGAMSTDATTRSDIRSVEDPEDFERVTKQDDIDNGQAMRSQRTPD